jgi:hypothetical protein
LWARLALRSGFGKAAGCTLYKLLGGDSPFLAAVQQHLAGLADPTPAGDDQYKEWIGTAILKGQYDYLGDRWNGISREAKDMTDNLLWQNPDKHYSPASALKANWMKM